jgi:hypothetical protein
MLTEAFPRAEINFDPAGFVFAVIDLVPLLPDERRQDAPDKALAAVSGSEAARLTIGCR